MWNVNRSGSWIWLSAVFALVGCSEQSTTWMPASANTLGLTRIEVTESGNHAIAIGRDDAGTQIGKLELDRGRLVATAYDEAPGTEFDGRRMAISVVDQQASWDTAGEEPLLHMPTMPQVKLSAFVAESHVKALLARWNLGFQESPGADGGEIAYDTSYTYSGSFFESQCSGNPGVSCPIRAGTTTIDGAGNCDGGTVNATVLSRHISDGYQYEEDLVGFACNWGYGAGGWWGLKSCLADGSANPSTCGTPTGSNKCTAACPGFGPSDTFPYSQDQGYADESGTSTMTLDTTCIVGSTCDGTYSCGVDQPNGCGGQCYTCSEDCTLIDGCDGGTCLGGFSCECSSRCP